MMEAPVGLEPTNRGFAIRCLANLATAPNYKQYKDLRRYRARQKKPSTTTQTTIHDNIITHRSPVFPFSSRSSYVANSCAATKQQTCQTVSVIPADRTSEWSVVQEKTRQGSFFRRLVRSASRTTVLSRHRRRPTCRQNTSSNEYTMRRTDRQGCLQPA